MHSPPTLICLLIWGYSGLVTVYCLKLYPHVLFIFSVQKKIHTGLVLLFFPNNSKVNCSIEYQCADTLDEVWAFRPTGRPFVRLSVHVSGLIPDWNSRGTSASLSQLVTADVNLSNASSLCAAAPPGPPFPCRGVRWISGGCRAISGHISGPFGTIGGDASVRACYWLRFVSEVCCNFRPLFMLIPATATNCSINHDVILFCPYIYKNMVVRMCSYCANHLSFHFWNRARSSCQTERAFTKDLMGNIMSSPLSTSVYLHNPHSHTAPPLLHLFLFVCAW